MAIVIYPMFLMSEKLSNICYACIELTSSAKQKRFIPVIFEQNQSSISASVIHHSIDISSDNKILANNLLIFPWTKVVTKNVR